MTEDMASDLPVILFGAFDRHNFGDLLFPHIAAKLLDGKRLIFAGLAERDMRCHGGHLVQSLAQLAAAYRERPADIVHAGGELLTCNAWQAAAMLLPPDQAHAVIQRLDRHPREALEWARAQLGIAALAPYTVSRGMFPHAANVIYNAVGGVGLQECDPAMQAEVLVNLGAADEVTVRDKRTQDGLHEAGIAARLIPDPAVMVAELFGETIREHVRTGEVARVRSAFPKGYLAVQFSTEFGDDETLATIAAQLDRFAQASGKGIVFFRAGAAPWHDDVSCYQRVAERMRTSAVHLFGSLSLWDICALIAAGSAYVGSSLHGRIVAMACALPRITLRHAAQAPGASKQEAFISTWDVPGMPSAVGVEDIAHATGSALAADRKPLRDAALQLAACYREGFGAIHARLNDVNRPTANR
ncbi:polysaccharide pyruvyl transferase family protein [Noviherbaspirillum sp.]|uniref:polysaccharide pyruvyl transferase family protein n=1 Tax=Noviherbaspirillum sp. TaxID=1926288 RepID=UPI002B45DD36|nr:polysaccharide pyruvyl transferase family protein [Noviherbaspirillum sp.]HJV81514.1 polysaccharide pyruvyl transferase family protein [Noviherbaspirillum sp.]